MTFNVNLKYITWDRETDFGRDEDTLLPGGLYFEGIEADCAEEAMEVAMDKATDLTGFFINNCEPIVEEY